MPAQPSQTRICNAACVHLGTSARILAINEGSPLANAFAAVWDEARDEIQADHPWNPCLHRCDLAVSADYVPSNEYEFAYALPGDCLRWLPWREDHEDYFDGEQEGAFLLTNSAAPIYIRYIRRVENVASWSTGMNTAMAAKLAAKTAKAITGQSSMIDRMNALYDVELGKGKRQDGLSTGRRNRTAVFRSDWLNARGGSW